MQAQLNVCEVKYGDFVVWTESSMVMERIYVDREFFESVADKVEHFFTYGALLEIVGKWYTRKHIADEKGIVRPPTAIEDECQATTEEDPYKSWCYCGQPSYGQMIMWEHEKCTIVWFHFDCLRIRCPPKSQWYCPSCRKLPKSSSTTNKKRKKK